MITLPPDFEVRDSSPYPSSSDAYVIIIVIIMMCVILLFDSHTFHFTDDKFVTHYPLAFDNLSHFLLSDIKSRRTSIISIQPI